MEDNREVLGTLSEKFKTRFIHIFISKHKCDILNPVENKDPNDIPLILVHPKTTKNGTFSITIDRANINFRDMNGNTLLHLAVINYSHKRSKQQLKIIRALINANNKVDINVSNQKHQTPLALAASNDPIDFDLIEALIAPKQSGYSDVAADGLTLNMLLREAILNNRPRSVDYLLRLGASPTLVDEDGKTALHYAFEDLEPNDEIIQLLEDNMKERYAHHKDLKGGNLLHYVAHEGIVGVLKHLVNLYDVNSRSENGLTPIALAVNKPAIVRELIKAGARPWNWTASQIRKPTQKEMRGVYLLIKELKKENENSVLNLQDKPPAVQSALFNLVAYTGKLKSDLEHPKLLSKTHHMQEKYDALKEVVKDLLTENNPETMKTKLTAALKNDSLIENRSKIFGFYRIHGLFARKRNIEDPTRQHYVNSTTEELLYDLKKAIDNPAESLEKSSSKLGNN